MQIVIGDLIGKGNTADVFDMDHDKVVKLFHAGYSRGGVEREYENSKLLHQFDIPAAKSYEIITYEGRYGIVYDKIDGISLLDILFQTYDIEKHTKILASMHQKILGQELPSAVSCKTILRENIEDTDALSVHGKAKLLQILKDLPDGNCLCHGDFHFGNILMARQEYYVIDFMNVCKGDRNFDVARTVYLTEMTPVPEGMPDQELITAFKKQAADIYLKEMGIIRESLSNWLTVIAAARLSELGSGQIMEKHTIMKYLSKQGLR